MLLTFTNLPELCQIMLLRSIVGETWRKQMANLTKRMQGPTGRITELTFTDGVFSGFRITESNGSLVDDLHRNGEVWKSAGGARQANDVFVDDDGNISIVETDGNRTAHLACGEEMLTRYRNGKPTESLALRDGKETARFGYEYPEDGRFSAYARFPGMAEPVQVKPEDTVIMSRLRAAGLPLV
jgi:hypothetical protein